MSLQCCNICPDYRCITATHFRQAVTNSEYFFQGSVSSGQAFSRGIFRNKNYASFFQFLIQIEIPNPLAFIVARIIPKI